LRLVQYQNCEYVTTFIRVIVDTNQYLAS
jgi:hypothetical protein